MMFLRAIAPFSIEMNQCALLLELYTLRAAQLYIALQSKACVVSLMNPTPHTKQFPLYKRGPEPGI